MTITLRKDGALIDDHTQVHGRVAKEPAPPPPPPRANPGVTNRRVFCRDCSSMHDGFACAAGHQFHIGCGTPRGVERVAKPAAGCSPVCPYCKEEPTP